MQNILLGGSGRYGPLANPSCPLGPSHHVTNAASALEALKRLRRCVVSDVAEIQFGHGKEAAQLHCVAGRVLVLRQGTGHRTPVSCTLDEWTLCFRGFFPRLSTPSSLTSSLCLAFWHPGSPPSVCLCALSLDFYFVCLEYDKVRSPRGRPEDLARIRLRGGPSTISDHLLHNDGSATVDAIAKLLAPASRT